MPDYRLLVAAVAFLLFILWRVRPALADDEEPPKVRGLDTAKDDDERATLLADAGDAYAQKLGGARRAASCYARAMRLRPESRELVTRAAASLAKSPKVLEALAWRRLGAGAWDEKTRPAVEDLLAELVKVYDGAARTRPRARAIEHVLTALRASPPAPAKPAPSKDTH